MFQTVDSAKKILLTSQRRRGAEGLHWRARRCVLRQCVRVEELHRVRSQRSAADNDGGDRVPEDSPELAEEGDPVEGGVVAKDGLGKTASV